MQEHDQKNQSGKKPSRGKSQKQKGKDDDTLIASEERFSAAFRFSPIGMAIFRASDGCFVDVNDMFIKASGYAREEIIGHNALELNLYADPKERDMVLKTLMEQGSLDPFEFTTRNKSGEIGVGLSATTKITLDGEKHYLSMILDITERKRMEIALRENEKQIKQLIDASPVAMVVSSGGEERVESVNDKFIELFGYTIEDMPDVAHWWPLAYPDEKYREGIRIQWKEKAEQAIRDKGQIEPMEAMVTCRDGSRRYVEFRLSSIGQKHLVMFVDLTERKQAEDALRERERHSQSLLRLSRNLERAQTYTEALNTARDGVKDIIGYQNLWAYLLSEDKKHFKALVAGGPMSDEVMSEDGTATLTIEGDKMLEEIAEAKEIVIVEDAQTDDRTNKEIVARLGNRTIVNVPIILFDRHLGSIGTGTFGDEGVRPPTNSEREYLLALASHMAVTLDRIHLLTERRQVEQSLRESEERFRSFVEKANDIVYTVSPDGVFTYVSPNWKEMLGHEISEVEGKLFEIFVHPDDLAACRAILNRTIVSGEKQSGFEYRVKHKNGSWQWHTSNSSVIRDSADRVVSFLGIARNITEHKQAEEKVKQQLSELERWYNVTLNREDRVQELKREVNQLLARLGEPTRYTSQNG